VVDAYRGGRCEFLFFQAEDGIRDRNVTGVQTCALPISQDQFEGDDLHLPPGTTLRSCAHRMRDAAMEPPPGAESVLCNSSAESSLAVFRCDLCGFRGASGRSTGEDPRPGPPVLLLLAETSHPASVNVPLEQYRAPCRVQRSVNPHATLPARLPRVPVSVANRGSSWSSSAAASNTRHHH